MLKLENLKRTLKLLSPDQIYQQKDVISNLILDFPSVISELHQFYNENELIELNTKSKGELASLLPLNRMTDSFLLGITSLTTPLNGEIVTHISNPQVIDYLISLNSFQYHNLPEVQQRQSALIKHALLSSGVKFEYVDGRFHDLDNNTSYKIVKVYFEDIACPWRQFSFDTRTDIFNKHVDRVLY